MVEDGAVVNDLRILSHSPLGSARILAKNASVEIFEARP